MSKRTPRVFIIRHGETEWSLNGRHTSTTDLPLTPGGEMRIKTTGEALIGEEKLICPTLLAYVYFSPRLRAKRTLELLGLYEKCPRLCERSAETDQLVEWDYGDYEGLTSPERRMRHRTNEALADRPWDIWRDGCVGGESPEDVERRCDAPGMWCVLRMATC